MLSRFSSKAAGAVLALMSAVLLAGCPGAPPTVDDPDGPTAVPEGGDGAPSDLAACLNGIGFPAEAIEQWPSMDHPAWEDERWEHEALVCADDLGLIDYPAADPAYVEERNAAYRALIQCIEAKGWDLPEPRVDTDGSLIPVLPFATENPESLAASQADFAECGDEVGIPMLPADPDEGG